MVIIVMNVSSMEIFDVLGACLPDNTKPYDISDRVKNLYYDGLDMHNVLDLGCGSGNSVDFFDSLSPKINWRGVDIEGSPEVDSRIRSEKFIESFNGIDLPYKQDSFELIYCNQVLEHVRYPDELIRSVFRVLKPKGLFVGAVSYLEPYHSRSIFNFTPYGVFRVLSEAGFVVKEIGPGVDASLLINRQILNRSRALRFIWNINYIYGLIDVYSFLRRLSSKEINMLKLNFAGHINFLAYKKA